MTTDNLISKNSFSDFPCRSSSIADDTLLTPYDFVLLSLVNSGAGLKTRSEEHTHLNEKISQEASSNTIFSSFLQAVGTGSKAQQSLPVEAEEPVNLGPVTSTVEPKSPTRFLNKTSLNIFDQWDLQKKNNVEREPDGLEPKTVITSPVKKQGPAQYVLYANAAGTATPVVRATEQLVAAKNVAIKEVPKAPARIVTGSIPTTSEKEMSKLTTIVAQPEKKSFFAALFAWLFSWLK